MTCSTTCINQTCDAESGICVMVLFKSHWFILSTKPKLQIWILQVCNLHKYLGKSQLNNRDDFFFSLVLFLSNFFILKQFKVFKQLCNNYPDYMCNIILFIQTFICLVNPNYNTMNIWEYFRKRFSNTVKTNNNYIFKHFYSQLRQRKKTEIWSRLSPL